MIEVLITGAKGFIGKNLVVHLDNRSDIHLHKFDHGDSLESLELALKSSEVVFHLAGVNRPTDMAEFAQGNRDFTGKMLEILRRLDRSPLFMLTSSIQAELDNPYGKSKKEAEELILEFYKDTPEQVYIFRLTNVFGKWCRPFYNSVVATFCHQLSHGEEIRIDDATKQIEFVYIDDLVSTCLSIVEGNFKGSSNRPFVTMQPTYRVELGDLADRLRFVASIRKTGLLPDLFDPMNKYLYATYLSYLEADDFAYQLEKKSDDRGYLFELLKSAHFGQMFVSRTYPGISRGNHYHHTKVEKFVVVEGQAKISFRQILGNQSFDYLVEGSECRVVDIPPGYTHSITNIGETDLITLFWANEIFDANHPDTTFLKV